jgi:hypothetical protein
MIEYRKNNFIKSHGTAETFCLEISPTSRSPKTYCEELLINAQEIWNNREGTLYALYSGGIDSEVMLEAFLTLKLPIIPVIVNIHPQLNQHDLDHAFRYCKKRNLQPLVIDIDFHKFVNSREFLEIAEMANSGTYQYITTMKAALDLKGSVLCGNEEPYLSPDLSSGLWYYTQKEAWEGWGNLYKKGLLKGTSAFHSWTPETFLSFLLDPTIVELGNNRLPGKLGTFSSRRSVYTRMFELEERPKYTGYEQIDKLEDFNSITNIQILKEKRKTMDGVFKIEYNQLVELLKGTNAG